MDGTVATAERAPAPAKRHFNGATAVERRTDLLSKSDRDKIRRRREAEQGYGRGKKVNLKTVRDKKLRGNLKRLEQKYETAALRARDAEILHENTSGFLEPETELERTYKVRQQDITSDIAVATAQKRFELKLDQLGPYIAEYSRNGRDLLMAGRKGHLATMDWREGKLGCELQLGETIRDAKWLHNNQFFAVAQKNSVYIYDKDGVELHNLTKHREVTHMEFLPYHFLLCTVVSTLPMRSWFFFFPLLLLGTRTRLTVAGDERLVEIPGHLDGSDRHRDADQARSSHGPDAKPV